MTDKIQGKQQEEKDNDTQGTGKIIYPKDNPGNMKTNLGPLPQSWPEETQKNSRTVEVVSKDMEIGDLELDRMEVTCSNKDPTLIPP